MSASSAASGESEPIELIMMRLKIQYATLENQKLSELTKLESARGTKANEIDAEARRLVAETARETARGPEANKIDAEARRFDAKARYIAAARAETEPEVLRFPTRFLFTPFRLPASVDLAIFSPRVRLLAVDSPGHGHRCGRACHSCRRPLPLLPPRARTLVCSLLGPHLSAPVFHALLWSTREMYLLHMLQMLPVLRLQTLRCR